MKQFDRNMLRTGSAGRAHLLALEPRMMFDAAIAATTEAVGKVDSPLARADAANSGLPAHVPAPIDVFTPAPAHDAAPAENAHAASEGAPAAAGAPDHGTTTLAVFDGDASDGGVTRIPVDTAHELHTISSHESASAATQAIVFIDTSVDDYQQLAAQWASQAQVVLIDGTRDGIDQIRAALAGQTDISAIHIVSHGDQGEFWIGTTRVDQAAIDGDLAGSLAAIGRSLAQGGDILIYGCDFAEGDAGAAALASFARATGADVAASTDVTGYAPRGGDWVLEAHSGSIEARSLDGGDWAHTLDPNTPVPISVTADSLTVTNGQGTVVVSGTTGYGTDSRSPDVGVGSVARWSGAATFNGQSVDLIATVVSLSAGDAVRFNRPTGTGANGDDPTFLLRDLTTGASDAIVQIRWSLVVSGTNTALPADVRFTIADIDGIGGNPNSRETVSTSTDNLAYFTRERVSDIAFTSSLNRITASGTQNENTDATQPVTPKSAATFDWTKVSSFDLTYTLTTNTVTTQAQFYQDGDADFLYSDPVYVSIPRLDLDGNDSTAAGNDAHFTFTENGPGVPVVDTDVVVTNPMDINAVIGASVTLTNYQAGDMLSVGTLPANIAATVGAASNGRIVVTLTGNGSETDYDAALKAIRFSNTSDTPSTTQRVLTVSFSNDTLTSAVATSRIDVIAVNDFPTARNDSATTAEDTAVTIAVLVNDTDPDGDPLTVTSATALHGSVVRNADGTLTYTPNANYNGTDTISYAISDGQGGTSNATVAVTITPVNDAPTSVGTLPDRASSDGAAVSYATAGGFTDVDGDALSYTATGLPAGLTINASTGVISGTIDRSASQAGGGSYAVVVTARDPSNAATTQRFTLTATNPAPTAVNDSATTAEDTAVTIAVLANDTDPDGDPLTVTSATALHGSVVRNADGTVTYTPNANYNGTDTISYAISDGQGGTSNATVAVTITPVNDAPASVGTLPDRASSDGAAVSYATAGGFTDIDGDALTYTATGLPAGLTINASTGVISGTIDRSASQVGGGSYAVVVTARDPSNAATTQRFTLTATNPAPTARNDSATTAEDTAVTIAVLANDTDPDGDPLAVTSATALHGSVVRNTDGTLTYTPNANYNGTDTISYAISDGQGGTSNATVAVTITPVNDAPASVGTLPDRASSDGAAVSYATAGGFTDIDGDTLTYTATGLPAGLTINASTGVISGTIDRSASQVSGGAYAVVVTARDPSNAATTQRFTLTATNPAPTAVNDSATTAEDTAVTIAVLANDTDPDGDPLTVTSATALHGSVVRNADGTLTYTPNANYNGTDTISYAISDGQGGVSNATVAVTITPVNDAPASVGTLPDRASSDGAAVSYATAGGFTDVDGDALSYTATGLPVGLTINASTGVISGTIDRSASQAGSGAYAIVVTARDSSNAATTQRFTLTATNPAPTAVNDSATTAEDTAVTIAVLANDTDPDGDPLAVTSATALHGSVVRNADGTLTYTPNANYNGTDTISYAISDGQSGVSNATVAITITPVNDAPASVGALPDRASTDGAAVSYATAGGFTDIDGDTLTYTATGLPAGLTINASTGVISGTIDRSASQAGGGSYAVVVTARDPSNAATTQRFTLTATNPAPTAVNDSATTAEDTAVTIAVLANDSDPDGDPLTVTSATALHGSVVRNADGTLTYTPNANYNGTDTISYAISDGQGGVSNATVAITITPVNDAPASVGTLPDRASSDGAAVSYATVGGFTDIDGDTLTYTATGLPAGLTINASTGVISGTIDRSASQAGGGSYAVVVTARDPSGAAATQTFALSAANPAPTANADAAMVHVDTPTVIAVLGNDSDPDGDPLSVIDARADRGTVVILADGTLRYTPPALFAGQDMIVYTISDGQGGTATATVTITIVNAAPTAGVGGDQAAADGQSIFLPIGASVTDADGDPLVFTATGLPAGLSIDPATGLVSGIIDRGASQVKGGVYDTVVTADDGHGGTSTTLLHWTITNPAPIARDDTASVDEDGGIVIAPLANDSDPDGDPLTIVSAVAAHGSVTINSDGTITYRPDADFNGTDTIAYVVTDSDGARANASIGVAVAARNDAPTTTGLPARSDVDAETVSIPTSAVFADVDGDMVTYSATGLPLGLSIDPVTGVISGTITPGANRGGRDGQGHYTVIVTATDPSGLSVDAPFTWSVLAAGPIARGDTATTREDVPVTIAVLDNDSDPDGDPLTLVEAVASHGAATIVDGRIVFTPDKDFNGTAIVTYQVSDPAGNRTSASVTITVVAVNDAPVAQPLSDAAGTDGLPVTLDVGGFFADPDGDALRFTATGLPAGLTIDPVTGRISGTVDRSASQVAGGTYRVVVTATDPSGEAVSSGFDWAIANPAPTAANDRATTAEDTSVRIAVLGNDVDPDGDPLSVVSANAGHGSVVVNADGTLAYTPDQDFNGNDVIVYTISDAQGGTSTASVLVTITPVQDVPRAVDDRATLVRDTSIDIPVLANDSDPDGDPLTVIAATATSGSVTINPDGTLRYVPIAGFVGTDVVVYTIADGRGGTASATVTLTVTPPNRAPVAQTDVARTAEDSPVTIAVLANDSDQDGDPLVVTSVSAAHGSVVVNADGTLTYTPDANYTGTDTLRYTITDGRGGTATADVTITIDPVNDAPMPVGSLPDRATSDGAAIAYPTAAAFADGDGDAVTYTASGLPAGLTIDATTGIISGTIDRGASQVGGGRYGVLVTARDPSGATASQGFTLTATNPAPIARDDAARTDRDVGVVIPVLANDSDPDGDAISVTGAIAAHGSVTINPDGTLAYIPGASFTGTDTIRYTITDSDGATATALVTVTVDPVNRAPVVPVGAAPVDATGGRPTRIAVLDGVTDPDGDRVTLTGATTANGAAVVNPDNTVSFTPALGFVGNATITYTVADGRGGISTGTVVVRVADGRGADIEQLLDFGRPRFVDPSPRMATIRLGEDGEVRNPLSVLNTVEGIRSLNATTIGRQPVGDAVEAIRSLRGTGLDPDSPILAEVARLDAIRDQRDAGDRLFDHRWGDFMVQGLTGFSATADQNACIMVESVVRGGAIYVEVRDIAEGEHAEIRAVDVRLANGHAADFIHVDKRGLAIIERGADMDELHLIVRVTRENGRTTSTPIVIQGQTGEIELDRPAPVRHRAAPLDATLHTPGAAASAAAARLSSTFE
ncbi:Ig-like domain-containing protein [Sphingomonas sp. R86520]|uniref:Ig-like domain-containing protein n=1 Tax=Sphingomonas sp. R86520 TaxID=3093859 RepID=UPI0036D2213A